MKIGIDIKDITSYTENMSKGLDDKLFFLNRIKFNDDKDYIFVDFGCADGVLINALYEILESKGIKAYYVGYDISDEMISLAKSKCNFSRDCATFTSDWSEVEKIIKGKNVVSILILSSVVHEVYSYARPDHDDIGDFWKHVRNSGFKYICVRDMMCSQDINRETNKDLYIKFSTNLDVNKDKMMCDFEKRWGSTEKNNKNFVHFLLKYRWKINWDREVNENYFPLYIYEFTERFNDKYNMTYFERFRVPYLDKCIKEDFNIELEDYTHVKMIFEAKKNG